MSEPFPYDEALRAVAAADEPAPEELARLRERVRADLRRPPAPSRSRSRWAWGAVACAGLAAAAAVATVLATRPPVPVELGEGRSELAPGVTVAAEGEGVARTEGRATDVAWARGLLQVEVDPAVHARVSVRTDEALVTVRGTVFDVDRGSFGTRVTVSRGRVEVTCASEADAPPAVVDPGGERWCLRDAAAGLGLVLRLEATGAPAQARLEAVERALAHPAGGDEAREALRARQSAVWAELAGERLRAGDCAGADPWLARLESEGDADAAAARRGCLDRR